MMRTTMLLGLALAASLFVFPGSGANLSDDLMTSDEPSIVVHEFNGKLVCHLRSGLPGCPAQLGQDTGETFTVDFLGVQGMLLEMDWTPALPVVGSNIGLNTIWNTVDGGDGSGAVNGAPTLRMYFEAAADNETFCLEGCDSATQVRAVLPGVNEGGQVSYNAFQPLGAPAANQEFTIYVSFFVNQAKPDGYTAIPSAGSEDPNIVVHEFNGNLVCHVRSGVPGCPAQLGQDTGETFSVDFLGVTGMLLEMDWDSAFPVANSDIGLNTIWNTVDGGDGSGAVNGGPILRMYFEAAPDNETFCLEGCDSATQVRAVLPGVNEDGQISYNAFQPIGAPALFQPFTIYLTLFVNEPMPACYSSVPGNDVCLDAGLDAPQNLQALPGPGGVDLSWDAVEDADSYRVYRATSGLTSGVALAGATTGTTFTDDGCALGAVCAYTVAAVNEGGQGPSSGAARAAGTAT